LPNAKINSLVALLLCSALAVFCFGKSLHYAFLEWDDQSYIINDPAIQEMSFNNLGKIWNSPYKSVWYPLARTSHAIDIRLFGHDAYYHRLVSLILYIINGLLVYLLASRIIAMTYPACKNGPAALASTAAALVFIAHPQHVEVVAWLTQRNELLATAFFLLSLIQYCAYLSGRKQLSYFCALLFAALAMTAKPTAVGIPVILLLFDRLFDKKTAFSISLLHKIPFIAITACICYISIATHENAYAVNLHEIYELKQRLCYAASNIFSFFYRFFVPFNLTPVTTFPTWIQTLSPRSWLPVFALALISVICAIRLYRKTELISLLLIAYLTLVLPGSGLLMFGYYSPGNRYMYLPSALLVSFLALGFYNIIASNTDRMKVYYLVPMLVLVTILALLTRMQVVNWKNDLSLWSYAAKQQPKSATALVYLGSQLASHNILPPRQAAAILEEAVSIEPLYIGFNNLLILYAALNDTEMLLRTHARLIQYYPQTAASSYVTLGLYELAQRHNKQAIDLINEGVRIDPSLCTQIQQQIAPISNNLSTQYHMDLDQIMQQAYSEQRCQY
jgi:tetratricopeptide (TPR) repeat protein